MFFNPTVNKFEYISKDNWENVSQRAENLPTETENVSVHMWLYLM